MRLDTWVFWVSVALPVVCVVVLVFWNLLGYLEGKFGAKRRVTRVSPEPPARAEINAKGPKGSEPTWRARELLTLANDDFRNQRFLSCLERCRALTVTFSDLPEAAEAKHLSAEIKQNPERLNKTCAALAESLAEMNMELAETWLRCGNREEAAACYRRIVQCCPDNPLAKLAENGLLRIAGGIRRQ